MKRGHDKAVTFAAVLLLAGTLALANSPVQAQDAGARPIYLTDMSRCQPQAALTPEVKQGAWHLIPYETVESALKTGTMLGAASFVNAPDVLLPLNVKGWHAISIGFWNPDYQFEGGTTVKVKLSDDPCFTRIHEPDPGITAWGTSFLKEAPFKAADLTGRTLQFGKLHGLLAERAYIAYVKLVPLSAQQVADLQADRARADTRIAQVTIDGISCFSSNEYRTKEHLLELVEPYRYSDVGKVIWAVCYGDLTNYPSTIGAFFPNQLPIPPGNSVRVAGERATYDSLRSFAAEGIIPEAVAAEHVHAMGLKFDVMFRLTMLGPIPPLREGAKGLVKMHPEFRLVARNGTPMATASYAFPEVRQHMVSIVREAAEKFDIDGASLGFVRGPEFMGYEQPVLDEFRKQYGEDGRNVGFDDPRMQQVRCRYLNAFVRDVRQALEDVGKRKGKRLELSAWIWPTIPHNRNLGLDVEQWMKQGWLQSVIVCAHGVPPDPTLIAAAKAHQCRFIFEAHGDATEFPRRWVSAYRAGVDGVAIWDCDSLQDSPALWPILRRAGHRQEIEGVKAFPAFPPSG